MKSFLKTKSFLLKERFGYYRRIKPVSLVHLAVRARHENFELIVGSGEPTRPKIERHSPYIYS